MSNANPEVIDLLNQLAEDRFALKLRMDAEDQAFKDAKARLEADHTDKKAAMEARAVEIDQQIQQLIQEHRANLIARGKQSFAIMRAKFQLRKSGEKTKVADANGVMKVAKRFGVVKAIAEPPSRKWKLDSQKFLKWLESHGEMRRLFEPYLTIVPEMESLHMSPNTNYTIYHDGKRISPPSITISAPDAEVQS